VTEYRASFDAVINFGNAGDLTVHGFRVDVPAPDVDDAEIAALFVASLGLPTDTVELSNVESFTEHTKGPRGEPSDHQTGAAGQGGRFVELGP
jgi:arylformamidase